MNTRSSRKRHLTAPLHPVGKRHLDLEEEIQQSPKRRRVELTPVKNETLTTKSFYGGREKKCFPHSPGRRKAVNKVLGKISDENTDSDSDCRSLVGKSKMAIKRSSFDFHSTSTESTDTDGEIKPKKVLKEKNFKRTIARKSPLEIYQTKKTPTNKTMVRAMSKSTGKLPRNSNLEDNSKTPIISGKKFFKTRSPGSACVTTGCVVRKGFDMKFVARKLKVSATPIKDKGPKKTSTKTVPVKSVKLNRSRPDKFSEGIISVDDPKETEKENKKNKSVATPINLNNINKDAAIDTANSSDLFSSSQNVDEMNNPTNTDSADQQKDTDNELQTDEGELDSLVDGSIDLFSLTPDSGRNTPSKETTSGRSTPISSTGSGFASSTLSSSVQSTQDKRLFSIFTKQATPSPSASSHLSKLRSASNSPSMSPLLRSTKIKDNLEQMVIDAGQKRFGVTQCETCAMVYNVADPDDETTHYRYHQNMLAALKFTGWKKENVVQEYPMLGSRIIKVTYDSPKYALKKIEEVNNIMNSELGSLEQSFSFRPSYQVFLYVSDNKRIEGCCIAEPLTEGYPVLPDPDSSQNSQNHPGNRPWYCSDTPVPAQLGISRIWVYSQARRQGIATKLLDCVRHWFSYGCVISKQAIAFSDPTENGKILAMEYTGNDKFLVYKFMK